MAKIQIREILPVEAQIEDLSSDMTDRIQGAGLSEDIQMLINDVFGSVEELIQKIFESGNEELIDEAL